MRVSSEQQGLRAKQAMQLYLSDSRWFQRRWCNLPRAGLSPSRVIGHYFIFVSFVANPDDNPFCHQPAVVSRGLPRRSLLAKNDIGMVHRDDVSTATVQEHIAAKHHYLVALREHYSILMYFLCPIS